ncbi:hypothetical protein [Spirosoma sp.]|uniref:hypothetical protein n=1 Tax=Spirosoma sp. TaxID=1899569 RepID=UPI003B3B8B8E
MGLHVINLSIDAPDQYGPLQLISNQSENLAINDIESFTELFLEQGLGIENAIPEHDEPDEESNLIKLKQDYVFTHFFVFAPLLPVIHFTVPKFIPAKFVRILSLVADVISPPPQIA